MRETMYKRLVFLVVGIIINVYAMEVAELKSPKSPIKYLTNAKRSRSASATSNPLISKEFTPRKTSKATKHESPEQRLLRAIVEAKDDIIEVECALNTKEPIDVNVIIPHGNTQYPWGKSPLMLSIERDNTPLVEMLLKRKDIDVNKSDVLCNTPLHYAAIRGVEPIIKRLLHDYRVNSFLKNNIKLFAYELINVKSCSLKNMPLKMSLIVRSFLDRFVTQEAYLLYLNRENDDAAVMNRTIDIIKKRMMHIHEEKEYQDLPADATTLPDYATDEFIRKMIVYQVQCQL